MMAVDRWGGAVRELLGCFMARVLHIKCKNALIRLRPTWHASLIDHRASRPAARARAESTGHVSSYLYLCQAAGWPTC